MRDDILAKRSVIAEINEANCFSDDGSALRGSDCAAEKTAQRFAWNEKKMHELGILYQIAKTVNRIAEENNICSVKHIALEVGEASGIVPRYLGKLFPVAVDGFPVLCRAELRIDRIAGSGFFIKEIGY